MNNVVEIIAVFFVVFVLIRSIKKASKSEAEVKKMVKKTQYSSTASNRVYKKTVSAPQVYKGMKSNTRIDTSPLRDDRNNDWLAKQLREEHRAFREVSDMFGLKIEHASHCDAKLLRNYHHLNCDAGGIDTAKGR